MIDPLSFLVGTLWSSITFGAWSIVLIHRWHQWRKWHDDRARMAVLAAAALWITAVIFSVFLALSVLVDLFEFFGSASRGLLLGMGMGAFTGAGILAALERDR